MFFEVTQNAFLSFSSADQRNVRSPTPERCFVLNRPRPAFAFTRLRVSSFLDLPPINHSGSSESQNRRVSIASSRTGGEGTLIYDPLPQNAVGAVGNQGHLNK